MGTPFAHAAAEAAEPPAGEPTSPTWGNLEAEQEPGWEAAPPAATGTSAIPAEIWSSMVGHQVQLTLQSNEIVTGNLLQDNGSSITLAAADGSVRVVTKASATSLKLLDAPPGGVAAVPGAAPGRRIDPTGKTQSQLITEELRHGELAPQYKKAKGTMTTGVVLTPLGAVTLAFGALFLAVPPVGVSNTPGIAMTATGVPLFLVGLAMLAGGSGQKRRVKKMAADKYSFSVAPNLARSLGGLSLVGTF